MNLSKPRIIYLVTSPISANVFGLLQIRSLFQHGLNVSLVVGQGSLNSELYKYVDSIYVNQNFNRGISLIRDVKSIIQLCIIFFRVKPDLVIYSTPKAAFLGSIAAFITLTKIRIYQIWGIRWQNLSGFKLLLVRSADFLAIKLSTNVTVVSQSALELLNYKASKGKVGVLGVGSTVGVDAKIFYPKLTNNKSSNKKIMGYAGRIARDKGSDKLIDLFISLSASVNNVYLEIIGIIDQDDKISDKSLEILNSHPNIILVPNLSQLELASHMQNWDIQIFLSEREGLGNVILEAGACGIPTFCWDIVGTRDAVPTTKQNFLIPYGDLQTLETSVIKYLEAPLSFGDRIELANWYEDNFGQQKVLNDFVTFIDELLGVYNERK
jgi:glycosyltransferase involved in cell wall biosynthesis